ncbi:conserved hypothetical protein [Desulfamplus magnetovallimortis]|uniref:Type II toxin-antitoxin system RelE/ParE family toxin n=1 Tax=Desulfamplus magnetovallimortis TaxID=1246637 RepID=A0A1W1HBU5_9BACT|nr:type II toxin-antitoxin system RelE/ParE family toxin [Desulfamplus magnetovallimortis]SLM29909.1 conserved hypothetical protein [Desulfamplus magnetovallimortis]
MLFTYDFAIINDKVPMIEFLESLTLKERAKVFVYIDKFIELKNNGLQPKENLSKHIGDGIFELRVSFGNRIARNFYFYESNGQIIFTHGFIKKEQKTPDKEIQKAISIRKVFRGSK